MEVAKCSIYLYSPGKIDDSLPRTRDNVCKVNRFSTNACLIVIKAKNDNKKVIKHEKLWCLITADADYRN